MNNECLLMLLLVDCRLLMLFSNIFIQKKKNILKDSTTATAETVTTETATTTTTTKGFEVLHVWG